MTAELSKRIGRDRKDTETLLHALNQALKQHCGDLDSVAIPAFGSFEPIKRDEKIVIDHSTGRKVLLPPAVELTFRPAAKLRKLTSTFKEGV